MYNPVQLDCLCCWCGYFIMKEIKLTKGYVTLVDDEDYECLNQWKWYAYVGKYTVYAIRGERIGNRLDNKMMRILMHRYIMDTPIGLQTDHIDHNGLNNQKNNLRICTVAENQYNQNPRGKSKYIGVSFCVRKYSTSIRISITAGEKRIHRGGFKTEEDAAIARDKLAVQYHGEFANLNFPMRSQLKSKI